MLVRILKDKNNNWEIHALSGPMYGKKLATAEGFRLSKARFQYKSVTGYLTALHGAQLEEEAETLAQVIRALGIGGVFNKCHKEALEDEQNSGWFDAITQEDLIDVKYVNGMDGRVFYSTQADIDADREKYARGLGDSITPPPVDLSATQHFQAGIKKLKDKILGS